MPFRPVNLRHSGFLRVSSPHTAAGPCRNHTGFPCTATLPSLGENCQRRFPDLDDDMDMVRHYHPGQQVVVLAVGFAQHPLRQRGDFRAPQPAFTAAAVQIFFEFNASLAVILASTIMFVRVIVIVAIVNPGLAGAPLLDARRCTGCASCVQSCPTETLEADDKGGFRVFRYAHFQCICCGSCVNVCPEDAAELRHELSIKRLVQVFSKREIRTVELEVCRSCGAFFAPEPQIKKIALTLSHDYIHSCPNCRKTGMGDLFRRLSPRLKSP